MEVHVQFLVPKVHATETPSVVDTNCWARWTKTRICFCFYASFPSKDQYNVGNWGILKQQRHNHFKVSSGGLIFVDEVLLCLFVSQYLGNELDILQDGLFMCTASSFVIVHNSLKIKSKLSQIKIQLTHKLSYQESVALLNIWIQLFSVSRKTHLRVH